ncbi:hypothetical protein DMH01_31790 [Amycolatopsis sp. WAC 04182]|nr:hypothetical protein DMH01_31790 [Amycolatopsis sp. WAC 04182]
MKAPFLYLGARMGSFMYRGRWLSRASVVTGVTSGVHVAITDSVKASLRDPESLKEAFTDWG